MRFGTAIERLVDNYQYAKSKIWIRDEVAWALYHTWKEADDRKTEPTTEDCSMVDCKYYRNPDYERCMECKRKQSVNLSAEVKGSERLLKGKDEPQTDCPWK